MKTNRTWLQGGAENESLLWRCGGATLFILLLFAAGGEARALGFEEEEELSRRGIFRIELTVGSRATRVSTPKAALGKLQAASRRVGQGEEFSATLNINGTVRQFDDIQQFAATCMALERLLNALKQERIPLGDIGKLDMDVSSSQGQPDARPAGRRGRDGDDGLGQGGGLGGQSGGGFNLQRPNGPGLSQGSSGGNQQDQQIAVFKSAFAQLLQRGQPLQDENQNQDDDEPERKEEERFEGPEFSGEAKLLGRATHGSYDKATYSFEFGIRDDPTVSIGNDWDLQFGSVPQHFHVTMVSDDRSRIVDLGNGKLDEVNIERLEKLPASPFPKREFVRAVVGHVYLVHTVDRNTDLYALFRVDRIGENDECDISWRRIPVPGTKVSD